MMKSAFDLHGIGVTLDPELLYQDSSRLTPDEQEVEEWLRGHLAWFPYRRLNHMDRTVAFVQAFDRLYLSMIDMHPEISPRDKSYFKFRGHYLNPGVVMAPWAMERRQKKAGKGKRRTGELEVVASTDWPCWLRARRMADRMGMIYEDYVAGALLASRRRGWSFWPNCEHLTSDKLLGLDGTFPDATIPGYERFKYAETMKVTHDPYFAAAAWSADPIQVAYLKHLASETLRVKQGMQAANRTWRGFRESGVVPAGIEIEAMLA